MTIIEVRLLNPYAGSTLKHTSINADAVPGHPIESRSCHQVDESQFAPDVRRH